MTKNDIAILINQEMNKVLNNNKENIDNAEIEPNPLAIQLATLTTIQVLQKCGIFPKYKE